MIRLFFFLVFLLLSALTVVLFGENAGVGKVSQTAYSNGTVSVADSCPTMKIKPITIVTKSPKSQHMG